MAPPLQDFGQVDKVANVNAIAVLRELGPLISAIVLTGFAGAAIAAELGTMAVTPVRFLVVPRVLATVIGLMVPCGLAGVGDATTAIVVFSIVSTIFADLLFTALFYALGWN